MHVCSHTHTESIGLTEQRFFNSFEHRVFCTSLTHLHQLGSVAYGTHGNRVSAFSIKLLSGIVAEKVTKSCVLWPMLYENASAISPFFSNLFTACLAAGSNLLSSPKRQAYTSADGADFGKFLKYQRIERNPECTYRNPPYLVEIPLDSIVEVTSEENSLEFDVVFRCSVQGTRVCTYLWWVLF